MNNIKNMRLDCVMVCLVLLIFMYNQGMLISYMVVFMIPSNTIQFQYFWDFNKCIRAIFSELSFKNLWLLFWVRLFWLKIIKNCFKSPLKVCELKVWVKQPPDVFQNVETFQQRKPNLNFIRVIKNSSFNQSLV